MFASDRFRYETPNVIDPGDAPPSHPSRTEPAWEPTDDIRSKATRLLSESNRPSSFRFVSKEKPFSFEDEDDVEVRGSQLPSVEDARMYAVSVLSSSTERMRSSPIFLRQAKGDSFSESLPLSMERTLKIPTSSERFVRRRSNCCRIICCMIIFAIALAVALISIIIANRNSSSPPSGPSARMKQTLLLLGQEVSSASDLSTPGTPQYMAADWIANRDQLKYPVPAKLDADSNRFLQRYVLAVLYFALHGDAWASNVNFLSATHECGWSDVTKVELGVTCSATLQVQGIKLHENNLSGALPNEVKYLSGLQYLSLRDNEITGSIPSTMRHLNQLGHIDMRRNQLVGRFPSWIEELEALQVLGLSDNLFTGPIPSGLSGLTKLTTLALDLNELDGGAHYLSRLTNLQYLYMDSNHFTGRLDEGLFDNLNKLVELTLADNNFESTTFPSQFLTFPDLRVIDFSVNAIAGTLPKEIAENTVLEYLTINENNLKGTIPSSIKALSALKQLDLSQNKITGSIPYVLNELASLQYLFMDQNKFKPAPMPQFLGSMTQLLELSLADTGITGTIPYWIKSLKSLESLDLRRNFLKGTIPASLWEVTTLQYLLLSSNLLNGSLPETIPLSKLEIAALHNNSLTGSAAGFCNNGIPTMTYDCKEVTCDCCNLGCCTLGVGAGSCYDTIDWVNDLGLLEHNYTLTAFGF